MKVKKTYNHPIHGEKTEAQLKKFASENFHAFNINEWQVTETIVVNAQENEVMAAVGSLLEQGINRDELLSFMINLLKYSRTMWVWGDVEKMVEAVCSRNDWNLHKSK